jgi:hypothetical protein
VLTEATIRHLLTVRTESATQDYKRAMPPKGSRNCNFLDLIKDVAAMANSGGGVIVFGVDNNKFTPVGLEGRHTLDETDLRTSLLNYLDTEVSFDLAVYDWEGKDFGFLKIEAAHMPLMFQKPADCATCKSHGAAKHFYPGAVVCRKGSSTTIAGPTWMREHAITFPRHTNSKVLHNLPTQTSMYEHFIGREANITQTLESLRDQRRRITWIQGSGGIGKTALAYRIADTVARDPERLSDIEYIVWVSAKDDVLTPEGIESTNTTLTSLDDLVRAILEVNRIRGVAGVEYAPITKADLALEVAREALEASTGLLVLDNMETVRDNEVFRFLRQLPGKTRALATTRHMMDEHGTESITLDPMTISESTDLIRSESKKAGNYWIESDDAVLSAIVRISGRIPLAVRLIVPRLTSRQQLEKYDSAKSTSHAQLLDFCYKRTFEKLSAHEKRVFLGTSLFEFGASLHDVAFMAKTSLDDVGQFEALTKTLTQLWKYSLLSTRQEGANAGYLVHQLGREFAIGKLARDPVLKQELDTRKRALEQKAVSTIEEMPPRAREMYERGDDQGALLVLEECLKQESKNVEARLLQAEIRLDGNDLEDAHESLRIIRDLVPVASKQWLRAMKVAVKIEIARGKYDSAIDKLIEYRKVNSQDNEVGLLLGKCYLRKGRAEKNPQKASAAYREAATVARATAMRAETANNRADAIRAFTTWAEAAVEYNPAVAFQAARRGLLLKPKYPDELESLRDKAMSLLNDLPERDLLDMDKPDQR